MFGYVRIYKPDLRVRDASYYKSVYCNLCKQISKDYGFVYRYFVSYDITFLCIVLNAIRDSEELHSYRCPFNPMLHGKIYMDDSILRYGAFMNYHMVIWKLKDNIQDDHSLLARILYAIMAHNHHYKKKLKEYDTSKLDATIQELYSKEDLNHSFDELTNLFGNYLVEMLKGYDQNSIEEMQQLVYLLGKWVYLIDAYDDLEKDHEDGSFNLLDTLENKENIDEQVDNFYYILADWMQNLFERIEWHNHDELIENILFIGTRYTLNRIRERYEARRTVQ